MLSKNGIARLRRMNTEINVQSRNNAMYVGQVFQQVLESEAGDVTFATFEQALRDSNSRVYLVARPASQLPHTIASNRMKFTQGRPKRRKVKGSFFRDKKVAYWLWTCMNGSQEAAKELWQLDVSADQNLENLKNCGNVVVDN